MLPNILILLIWFQTIYIVTGKPELLDYCKIHYRNTPCMYDCQRSSRCGNSKTNYTDLSPESRKQLIDYHNTIRRLLFSDGYVAQLKSPKHPVVHGFSYDKECEFFAGCYAKQCLNHPDKLRITLDGTRLGQNRFVLSVKKGDLAVLPNDYLIENVLNSAMHTWGTTSRGLKNQTYGFLHNSYQTQIYPHRMESFTQILWEKTTHLGCAIMQSSPSYKFDQITVICNYRPAGNIIGEKVYSLNNTPCRGESIKSRDKDHIPICIESTRDPSLDTYEPPIDLNMGHVYRCNCIMIFIVVMFCGFKN